MIASAIEVDKFEESAPSNHFQVQPPKYEPLVASSGLCFVKDKESVLIEWPEASEVTVLDSVNRMRADIVGRARTLVLKHPGSSRAHTNLGIALINQGELDEAEKELHAGIKLDARNYVASLNLARLYVQTGRLDVAEQLYTEMLQHFPSEPAPSLSLAFIAMKRADFTLAEAMLRKHIELDAESVLAKYQLAMVLIRLGKGREAISLLKKAVRAEVRSPALYHALGVAYAIAGDLHRAETGFRSALALAPHMRRAVHALARVLIDRRDISVALQVLTAHLEKQPDDLVARELLGRVYVDIEQYRSAKTQLMEAYAAIPDEGLSSDQRKRKAALANDIGMCFASDRNEKQAEVWFGRSIQISQDTISLPYENLGRLLLGHNRDIDASQVLSSGKAVFPDAPQIRMLIATVFERQSMYAEGVRELIPLIERGIADAAVYSFTGYLLENEGNLENSLQYLREGHLRYPSSEEITHNLSYVLLMKGNVEEGRALMEKYRERLESYAARDERYRAVFTATWGLLYILEGNVEVGARFYKQAARIAQHTGDRTLAQAVIQKMHLELARLFLKQGNEDAAKREILAGLTVRKGRGSFRRDLQNLETQISH
jgi:Flp pilus assembly protein TadD